MAQSSSCLCSWPPCPQDKAQRKKKEPPRELRQDPPVLRVLGSGQVYLEPLLAGEPVVSTVCNFGVARTLETDRLTYARVLRGPGPCPFVSASPLPHGKLVGSGRDGCGWEWWHPGGAPVVHKGCGAL